jgi:hypothetical protein
MRGGVQFLTFPSRLRDVVWSPAGQMRDEGRAARAARPARPALLPWSEARVCTLTEVETAVPTLHFP